MDSIPTGQGPELATSSVALRPLTPADYQELYYLETTGSVAWRWRQRGRSVSFEEFVRGLWTGVLTQFIVTDLEGTKLGLALAYDADFANGIARIAVVKFRPDDRNPNFLLGCALFINYVFYWWPFRKLYGETAETNFQQMKSGVDEGVFEVEGILKEYAYRDGQYESVFIVAISRSAWAELAARFQPLLLPEL